jgi:hypothetical protein
MLGPSGGHAKFLMGSGREVLAGVSPVICYYGGTERILSPFKK